MNIVDGNISASTLLEWTVEITKAKMGNVNATVRGDVTAAFIKSVHGALVELAQKKHEN